MTTIDELTARVEALTARVDAAEAVLAIQGLKAHYAEVVDARFVRGRPVADAHMAELAAEAASLFVEDGVWDGGPGLGVARGRAAIAARLAAPTLTFSRHLFVTPRIEVDGATATARWELLSPCTRVDGTSLWVSGWEDDTYVRTGGGWLHASMAFTTVFASPAGAGWPKILA